MIAGAYTLHLYCERCNKFGEFVGAFHEGAFHTVKAARAAGWRVDAAYDRALCATCKRLGWPVVDAPASSE